MSSNDIVTLPDSVKDYDSAARFLFQTCPEYIKSKTELSLDSPESFACLLHKNLRLFLSVKKLGASESLDGIWKQCINLARPPRISLLSPKPEIEVPLILDRIASKVKDLVSGKGEVLSWTLNPNYPDAGSDMKKVNLESLIEEKMERSMLFYELGSFRTEPSANERVKKLFCKGQNTSNVGKAEALHRFFVNASATGKTRLLYEGLCQNWGIYITAHADEGEARALELILGGRLNYERDLVRFLPRASSLGFATMLAKNRDIAYQRFSAVLLAHLYIFRAFLTAASTHAATFAEIQKRRWLLAQLYCPLLDLGDPYQDILRAVEFAPLDYIDKEITQVLADIRNSLPESVLTDGFFIAIDEANVATQEIWSTENVPHPALKEIIRTWRDRLATLEVPITFIVAGTEIPQEHFPKTSPEWSSWRWTSDTGAFGDPETQKQRRLTTSYIFMLLLDKLAHPHGVLDRWIEGLTGFTALDGKEYTTEEGPCKVRPFFNNIGSAIARKARPHLRSTTHEVIMTYIITGKHPPCFDISKVDLVSSGVAEFKDKDMSEIALDQPGPTIAAAVWLSKASRREEPRSLTSFKDFCSYFQGRWPNGDTYASASYIALYFAHAFKDGKRLLSDIFTVSSAPSWLVMDRKVSNQLVVLQRDNHGVIKELIVTPSALLPNAPPLGYAASTPNDVVAWLRHERSGAFCLCPPGCTADLIFIIRHRKDYLWVFVRTAGQGSAIPLNSDSLALEFEQLSVENLFPDDEPFGRFESASKWPYKSTFTIACGGNFSRRAYLESTEDQGPSCGIA
ncbi:hypothetical protein C0992_001540 [Termitomyces sp. T32_za158]|nr:hypothetical protein C0992_001540 [Termitomyces sp. T32_za158]